MNELQENISILNITVDHVVWDVKGIESEEDLTPTVSISFRKVADADNTIRSSTDFTFGNQSKTYFQCQVEVLAFTPGIDFDTIVSTPENRKFVADVCGEMAMGHIRNMLIYATSMAGLGTPILLSGIIPTSHIPGGFQESELEDTEDTAETPEG